MRPYVKKKKYNFDYPEQMNWIILYLEAHGQVLVSPATIEYLYRVYSEKYSCGWVTISGLNDPILENFSNWLDEYEM